MLSQHPVRRHFDKTRAHAWGQCFPWGHTCKQVLYLPEQVVAETGAAEAVKPTPSVPMNTTARESLCTLRASARCRQIFRCPKREGEPRPRGLRRSPVRGIFSSLTSLAPSNGCIGNPEVGGSLTSTLRRHWLPQDRAIFSAESCSHFLRKACSRSLPQPPRCGCTVQQPRGSDRAS